MKTVGIYDELAAEAIRRRVPFARLLRQHGHTPAQIRSAQSMLPEIRRRLIMAERDAAAWKARKIATYYSVRAAALLRLESTKSKSESADVALIEQLDAILAKHSATVSKPDDQSADQLPVEIMLPPGF